MQIERDNDTARDEISEDSIEGEALLNDWRRQLAMGNNCCSTRNVAVFTMVDQVQQDIWAIDAIRNLDDSVYFVDIVDVVRSKMGEPFSFLCYNRKKREEKGRKEETGRKGEKEKRRKGGDVLQEICGDTGCSATLLDRQWFTTFYPPSVTRHHASPLTVRGIGQDTHNTLDYAIININFRGASPSGVDAIASFAREVTIVDDLCVHMLLGMDCMTLEKRRKGEKEKRR
jgi:hypothetical protein